MLIEINLQKLDNDNTVATKVKINNITDSENVDFYNYHIEELLTLELSTSVSTPPPNEVTIDIINTLEQADTLTFLQNSTLLDLCEDQTKPIIVNGDFVFDSTYTRDLLQKAINKGFIRVIDNKALLLYRLNSKRNVVDKSLILVDIITGYFRSTVSVKNPSITIQDFNLENTFNYVFIPALKRYYYVNSVEITTKNMTALSLTEDVLMSHKDLIRSQTAFIERQESDYDDNLVDPLVTMKYDKNIVYTEIAYTTNIFNQAGTTPPTRSTGDFVITVVDNQD